MKKAFTLLFLFCSNYLFAQHILFSQDFDGFPGYNIMGWHHSFTGRTPWLAGLPYEVGDCMSPLMARTTGTNKVACVPACADGGDTNVFMYTPPINFSTTHGAWLRYDSYFEKLSYPKYIERATVEVSTDSGKTWAIVQDVPANPSLAYFTTYYVDLSAYDYIKDIWIGFRYSNDSTHSPYGMAGWAIDNVQVFIPDHKDIALAHVTPDDTLLGFATQHTGIMHTATIYNAGLDTIHSFVLKYQQGSGTVHSSTVTGVSIPRFSTYTFTHPYPDTVIGIGTYAVTMWVETGGDVNHANDTQYTSIQGAYFQPIKRLAIEEGTGTWDSLCPQGWVYMNQLATSDVDVCQVSVHDGDIMADSAYADYLFFLHYDYVPYMLVDRQKIEIDSLFDVVNVQKHRFGFADITLEPILDGNTLTLKTHVKPAVDISGDFRLIMIITEDDVTGPSPDYDQLNNYAGGHRGPMGGFESKPGRVPASDMYYNFVARSISSFDGSSDTLPHTLIHNDAYDHTFTTTLDPSWHKLRAIVMLLRNDDTTVLNANKTEWYLNVHTPELASIDAGIYPNPASEYAKVYFNLAQTENIQMTVTDINGRILYEQQATSYVPGHNEIWLPTQRFTAGMYLIILSSEHASKALKLDVLR